MVDSCVISSCVLIIGNCWCAVPERGDPLARGRDIPETPRSSQEGPLASPAGRGTSTCLMSRRQSICCSWRGRQRIISHLTVQHGARQVRCAAEVTLLRTMGLATTRTASTAGARCDTSRPVERKDGASCSPQAGPGRPRPDSRPSPATANSTANSASSDNPGPESWNEKPLSIDKCAQEILPGSRSKRSSSALPTQASRAFLGAGESSDFAPFFLFLCPVPFRRATTASRQPPVWDLGDAHVCSLP
jgi:hypothetical protein